MIARNVVLFTLVADQAHANNTSGEVSEQAAAFWHIFYHFYILNSHLLLLKGHVNKLLEHSKSLDTWASSPYGRLIRFLSQDSLHQLRRIWSLYGSTQASTLPRTQKYEDDTRSAIAAIYNDKIGQAGCTLHGVRAAGAHWANGMRTMSDTFDRYWKTGVTGGNRRDVQALSNDGKGRVNPMFAISSAPTRGFAVHYGSDPLLGFHLAEAFDTATGSDDAIERVVRLAKSQFHNWCENLAGYIKNDRIHISMHCGEAIRLCHELQSYGAYSQASEKFTRLYVAPWTSKLLALDGLEESSRPILFDVIDTSNLVDHVGPLNMLPAVVPLLRRTASSVLYTESLLQASEETTSALTSMLCSDVTAMSLMIGVTPIGHLLGITTDFVGTETLLLKVSQETHGRQHQYRMRVSWKLPQLGDTHLSSPVNGSSNPPYQVSFDAEQLAEYFFGVYHKMFAYEDMSAMMSGIGQASVLRQATSPLAADLRYYTRLNLVVLLGLVKRAVLTDWEKCMECFVDKVTSDRRLLVGANSLQELYLHLHLFGLWDSDMLRRPPRENSMTPLGMLRPPALDTGLLGQHDIPSVVFITLVIPRSKLEVFTRKSMKALGTPGLRISVSNLDSGHENSFFSLQCFFGKLKPQPNNGWTCTVEEDDSGWFGSADMIATCPVPAYLLLLGTQKGIRVSLAVNSTPSTVQFVKKLGIRLTVFQCGLDDQKHISILREAPGVISRDGDSSNNTQRKPPLAEANNDSIPHVNLDKESRAVSLLIHTDIPRDSAESISLGNGAVVSVMPSSPCTVLLKIGNAAASRLVYPFPVNGALPKTRVARKSSWVEVIVPAAAALSSGGYCSNPFPVVFDGSRLLAWGIPRVRLDKQPPISIRGDFAWLPGHMGLALSERERALNALEEKNRPPNGLLGLKESINAIFQSFVGINHNYGQIRNFQLTCTAKGGDSDTILFASALCHHPDSGSLVMDAYVMPITHARLTRVLPALQNYVKAKPLSIAISEEESVLWKNLLPALAERCRHSWPHSDTCEYRLLGRIPLTTAHGENPLCSCGEGRSLDTFPKRSECKPFAKYVTRIAISPISAVPYVESLSPSTPKEKSGKGGLLQTRQNRPSASNVPSSTTTTKCSNCGKEKESLKTCARCGKARYCDQGCQKEAWGTHKKVCGK